MKVIRGGSGLGDTLYIRPVAEHYINRGNRVVVLTDYPDVFIGCPVAGIEKHRKHQFNVLAHYTNGKSNPNTTQWQDVCNTAGVEGTLPLAFKWEIRNQLMVRDLKAMARGKPLIMINGGRHPMGREDGFANEMLPKRTAFDTVLKTLQQECFVVEVGKGIELYSLVADVDLVGRTTVSDLLDIAKSCDGLVGQCSFMIPLAEVFDKPFLAVWASQGLVSRELYIKQCTPQKILSKPATSKYVMDDWAPLRIADEAKRLVARIEQKDERAIS